MHSSNLQHCKIAISLDKFVHKTKFFISNVYSHFNFNYKIISCNYNS